MLWWQHSPVCRGRWHRMPTGLEGGLSTNSFNLKLHQEYL